MHQLGVDAVEVHVLDHPIGVAGVRGAVEVAVPRHRPPFEARRADTREVAHAALDERLDLEVLFPEAAIAQVRRQARAEQIRRFDDVAVGGEHKILLGHRFSG